ncbi:uncharacterized protein C8A04DRAFT_28327 [Dichotomopilus funicola]|uniref:Deoxyribonuclease NucA/NucB domain-containing protein n=1 Tax=Dichotomopilus funicola TaxID=1934379 RepID=A0AAN6V379_9PEZI|nr:hypothetical protein C8A04DRAFT_28327 [Dichotomopilus funicola]
MLARPKESINEKLECDEFPMASILEGGSSATRMCILASQNSKFQGPFINCLIEFYDIRPGQRFVVRMVSCSATGAKMRRRDDTANSSDDPTVQTNSDGTLTLVSNTTQWIPYPQRADSSDTGGTGFVVIPLGNATQGSYNTTLSFSSLDGLQHLAIVDSDGFAYWSAQSLNSFTGTPTLPQISLNVSAAILATVTPRPSSGARPLAPLAGGLGDRALAVLGVVVALAGGLGLLL